MPAPAVLPLITGGGAKLLSTLGLVKNLAATGAAVGAGTAIAGPFIAPGLFGQSAEQVLRKDEDKAEYDPVSKTYKVQRDPREQIFDKLFRREEAIQTQGEKNRLTSLLEDPATKELLRTRPVLKDRITGQMPDSELGNLISTTRDKKKLIDSIQLTGREPRPAEQLFNLDLGQLRALNTQRTDEKAVADIKLAAKTTFNSPEKIEERRRYNTDRYDQNQLRILQQKNLMADREDRRLDRQMERELAERRLDLQEARDFRKDRQMAIMQIMKGLQGMGQAFAF